MQPIPDGGERRLRATMSLASDSDFERLLKYIHTMVSPCFGRAEPRLRAWQYMIDMAGTHRDATHTRRNIVASAGRSDGAQRLLSTAKWDETAVRGKLVDLVLLNAGRGGGLYVIEASFPKKGHTVVATERQFSGEYGRITVCQNALLVFYGTVDGRLFLVDADLYVPSSWTDDDQRRREAKLPWHVGYRSKSRIARDLVLRVVAAGLRPDRVNVSLCCAEKGDLLTWLHHMGMQYLATLTAGEFRDVSSAGPTAAGMTLTDRAVPSDVTPARTSYYRACSCRPLVGDEMGRMIDDLRRAQHRWHSLRQQIGISRYEVRSWHGWRRHMVLAMAVQIAGELAGHDVLV